MFRRVPSGGNSLPVSLGAPKMQALAAREGMAEFSLEAEDDGHAFAAPLAPPFKILFDLAGDRFFVALALAAVRTLSLLKSIIGMAPLIEWRCPETSA